MSLDVAAVYQMVTEEMRMVYMRAVYNCKFFNFHKKDILCRDFFVRELMFRSHHLPENMGDNGF